MKYREGKDELNEGETREEYTTSYCIIIIITSLLVWKRREYEVEFLRLSKKLFNSFASRYFRFRFRLC